MRKHEYTLDRNRKTLHDEATVNKLVEENMRLVPWTFAHIIHKTPLVWREKEDILSEGYIALWEVAHSFDSSRGSFSTIAVLHITHRMIKYIRQIPSYTDKLINDNYSVISLDDELPFKSRGDLFKVADVIADSHDDFEVSDVRVMFNNFIKLLKPREQVILKMWSEGYNSQEIADKYNITRERVRQILLVINGKYKMYQSDELLFVEKVDNKRSNSLAIGIKQGTISRDTVYLPTLEEALEANNNDIGMKISSENFAKKFHTSKTVVDYARCDPNSKYGKKCKELAKQAGYQMFIVRKTIVSSGKIKTKVYIKEINK